MILDIDYTPRNSLTLDFFSIIVQLLVNLRASSKKQINKFIVILVYLKQILDIYLFSFTYLHTTCIIF